MQTCVVCYTGIDKLMVWGQMKNMSKWKRRKYMEISWKILTSWRASSSSEVTESCVVTQQDKKAQKLPRGGVWSLMSSFLCTLFARMFSSSKYFLSSVANHTGLDVDDKFSGSVSNFMGPAEYNYRGHKKSILSLKRWQKWANVGMVRVRVRVRGRVKGRCGNSMNRSKWHEEKRKTGRGCKATRGRMSQMKKSIPSIDFMSMVSNFFLTRFWMRRTSLVKSSAKSWKCWTLRISPSSSFPIRCG